MPGKELWLPTFTLKFRLEIVLTQLELLIILKTVVDCPSQDTF